MKIKVELIDKIVSTEETQLRAKFEKDLRAIRKKYVFKIEIQSPITNKFLSYNI